MTCTAFTSPKTFSASRVSLSAADKDIVDTAVDAGSFGTLVAAVGAAGLGETLKSAGPFTVFAPTDAAFAALPAGTVESLLLPENKAKLASILTYHVVSGKVMASAAVTLDGKAVSTVNGASLKVSVKAGSVFVDAAKVVTTDIECTNGVIHVIDAVIMPTAAPKPPVAINGWTPDANKFAWGLPGSLDPITQFDPLGFMTGASLDDAKKYREAELQHGRVAMLAALGFLVGENFHPLFGGNQEILAIDSLTQVRLELPIFFELLALFIGGAELNRALKGWVNPSERGIGGAEGDLLNSDYYPGDVGFDPLGLKPTSAREFAETQTKELSNGRLAMLGIAGMVAQELVDHKPILLNDFGI